MELAREPGAGCREGGAARPDRRPKDPARPRRSPRDYRPGCAISRTCQLHSRTGDALVASRNSILQAIPLMTLRVGIGGPVGSGKTALTLSLCRALRGKYQIAVVTSDIYTEEDAQFLVRNEALPTERIIGVGRGGWLNRAHCEDTLLN